MSWKKVTLNADDIAAGVDNRLQEAFAARFIAVGAPHDAVMYGNLDTAAEGYHFFFSPAAVAIAGPLLDSYASVDCPEPAPGTFAVLVRNATTGRGGAS
jgi:hypothetical protein